MRRLSVMVRSTAGERVGQQSLVITYLRQVTETFKLGPVVPCHPTSPSMYQREAATRRILRQIVDALTAAEANGSPFRVGLLEDDFTGDVPATIPPKRARTPSHRMIQEPSDSDTHFYASPRDIFGRSVPFSRI